FDYISVDRLSAVRRTSPTPAMTLESQTYDSSGRVDTTTSYDDDGTMVSARTRLYTEESGRGLNGRLSELRVKLGGWSDPPAVLKTLYYYNELGLIKQIDYPREDGDSRTRS